MAKLTVQQLQEELTRLDGWSEINGELVKFYVFPDFTAALAFVNRVGEAAETAGHHPDIDIRYNRVRLALVTHDEGGITARDTELAARADTLAAG